MRTRELRRPHSHLRLAPPLRLAPGRGIFAGGGGRCMERASSRPPVRPRPPAPRPPVHARSRPAARLRRPRAPLGAGRTVRQCLAWALARHARVETGGLRLRPAPRGGDARADRRARGDRRPLPRPGRPRLGADHVLDLSSFGAIGDQRADRRARHRGGPRAACPPPSCRGGNLVFLLYAAALAERRGIEALVGGMCETDASGYPDCRRDALDAQEAALRLGMARPFRIETPLMRLTKAQTWGLAHDLGGEALVGLIVEESHTCYRGERGVRHAWGYGCAACPACELARRGMVRVAGRGVSYAVKELFLTLQGEGGQAGRAAVFCRFAGCNLWSGREADRASAACTFCGHRLRGPERRGRRPLPRTRSPGRRRRRALAGRRRPAGRLHRRRAPAAAGRPPDRRLPRPGVRGGGGDQRLARTPPPASTGSASAPRAPRRWRRSPARS